ncbi:MAG TPA: hypothetical protein VGA70_07745 [Longimicrobiales bacterium]|jgi:hypothetical protein
MLTRNQRGPGIALIAALTVAACTESPSAPAEEETQLDALLLDVALPSTESSSADHDVPGHLERLLREALATLGNREGRDAVEKATARLRELHAEARQAREAGDEDAYRAAADAAHLEAAAIVVDILGTAPVERLRSFVRGRIREVTASLGERAAPEVRALLERARGLLNRSLGADRADQALVAASAAADVLSRLDGPTDQPGTLYALLGHALSRVAMEQGAEAARAIRQDLQALQERVARARQSDDDDAYRQAVNELETATARVVLRVLGPQVLGRVLESGANGLVTLERRIHRLEGTDVDPAPLRRRLVAATELHQAAVRSARQDRLVEALRLGARALDVLAGR